MSSQAKGGQANRPSTPFERLNSAFQNESYRITQHLEGKLLTIVDASFPDREQREAVKSLVRNAIWDNRFPMSVIIAQFSRKYAGKVIEAVDWKDSDAVPTPDFFRGDE